MRPLEQYTTLRKGRTALRQQTEKEWMERTRLLRIMRLQLVHWLGMRLVRWGYKLERYAVSSKISAL